MTSKWTYAKLGELTINLDTKRKPVKEADRKSGPYPYYGASGVVDYVDGFLFEGEHLLIAEDGENLKTRNTPIAFRATGKFWVNNHAHIVIGNERASTRYLEYAVLSTDISMYLTGAVMPKLTQGNLNRIEVPCPPREVQDAIVGVLGGLDDRIQLLRETNNTIEKLSQAIYKSWFVNFDPVISKSEGKSPEGIAEEYAALFPNSFEVVSGRKIPSGWAISSIYEIANVTYGAPFSSKLFKTEPIGKPLVRIRDLKDEKPGVFTDEVHPKGYLIQAGDVVVGMDGEFRAYVWGGDEAWLNQRVCVFHPTAKSCPAFVRLSLMPLLADIEASETATTVIHLGKNDIDRFKVILPTQQVQTAFSEIIDPLYKRLVSNKRQIQNLSNLRDTLLPRLISGQLSVIDESQTIAA